MFSKVKECCEYHGQHGNARPEMYHEEKGFKEI